MADLKKLKAVFESTLTSKEKKLFTVLKTQPLVQFLGEDYSKEYTKRREEIGIHLKSLRFQDKIATEPLKPLKDIRYSTHEPPEFSFIIWPGNVVRISDNLNVIEWEENATSYNEVKRWFDTQWNKAR